MSDLSSRTPESDLLAFPGEEPAMASSRQPPAKAAARTSRPPIVYDRRPAAPPTSAPPTSAGLDAAEQRRTDPLGLSLSELRTVGAQLVRAYGRLEQQCQEVDGRSAAALETLASIERRVGSLESLRDLSSTIDDRFSSLARIQDDLDARMAALKAQEALVETLEGRAAKSLSDARAADTALTALERRFGPTAEDVDRRAIEVGTQQRRLAEIRAVASTMESDLDTLERRIAGLAMPGPALVAAQANVAQLQRLAAEASTQLAQLQSEKAELQRVLAETRAELGRVRAQVRRLSLASRFERRIRHLVPLAVDSVGAFAARVRQTVDWGSVRSADMAPGLVMGLAAIALIALVASAVLTGPDEPPVLEATALVEPVDPAPPELAPRTTDIQLPATRAVSSRAGSERSRRAAAATGAGR